MDVAKLTEEQAKDQLAFYMELSNTQSLEIGRLTTELMKANISTRNLEAAFESAAKTNQKEGGAK